MYAPGWTSGRVDSNRKNSGSPKNQQQKREDVIYSIKTEEKQSPRGQKTLVYGLEDFFVTFLKLFNSRGSTFLEWSNCNTKFYKEAKQDFTKNAKTITAQKTKFEKPQRSKAKPKWIKTTKPQTQQLS